MTPKDKYDYEAVWMVQAYSSSAEAWWALGQSFCSRKSAWENMRLQKKYSNGRFRVVKYVPEGSVKP